ncbi:MAG TPA: hypothetical protein PKC69_15020 [Chitinophagaceae bacterium]|nr:hypothetical protein [Chitinophagaceae bacterium]
MRSALCLILLFFLTVADRAHSQRIVYSEPDKEDSRRLNFEIIGKINGNFLIYKNIRSKNWISILDNDMKQVARVEQDYLPDNDRVINVDFFPYNDFCYMIYQYRKRNIIYCAAAKIDGNGNKMGDLIELDTTQVSFGADNKIYSVISSEDKSKLMIFKINSKNKKLYTITTLLLDNQLSLQKKSRLAIPMDDRNDYLNEFQLDNDGDLIFVKFDRVNNENIGNASFFIKYAQADSFDVYELKRDEKMYFDEFRVKPDNYNKRYFITSFYFSQRRGNVEGYYFYIWDKQKKQLVIENTLAFSEELRREARGNSSTKTAFNDYFIRNIINRRDGGFIIASESSYTTSRGGGWNRWNNLYGSPFMRSYDYYYYSPYYNSFWGNRWNDNQNVRYSADNVVVVSFDSNGNREWNSVIAKQQFDDQTDDMLSYTLMNTGGQLHFLFNNMEKRLQLLTDFSLEPDGKINRNPTLKNLDRGYTFMPKYAKQVSARQVIIPCVYRNYICFGKLEYY